MVEDELLQKLAEQFVRENAAQMDAFKTAEGLIVHITVSVGKRREAHAHTD